MLFRSTWLAWLMPRGLNDASLLRSRFFVQAWLGAISASAAAAVLYAAAGNWGQTFASLVLVGLGPPLLWLHRRRVHFGALGHISLALSLLVFGIGTLAQRPADYTTFTLCLMTPMLAGFLLGRHAVLPWLLITFAWGAMLIVAIDHGWTWAFSDPMPTPSHVMNFGIGLFLVWLFSLMHDGLTQGALDRLRAADAARRAFLANISHEIRTPMNGVLGMTEVLLLEAGEQHREQLKTIQRSGRTLVSLINDLLDLSKMEAGKLTLERTDFSLARLLSDVQALGAPQASARGLQLLVQRGIDVPERLHGDGLRLGQVLNNLVSNAIKFTERGTVSLAVNAAGDDRYVFSVADTGPGIKAEVVGSLFKAFQQADSSTTRRFGGTGLGLALSQELISLMGGRIEVKSLLGRGSTFTFTVKLDEAEISSESNAVVPGPLRRRVLVVDDNPINLKVAVALVQKAGCEVESAENGVRALEALSRSDFDLVLMDCHMPEMDGFEATERIRALGGERGRTPVIALTASAMPDEIAACKRAGMNSVLAKPVTFAALQEVLTAKAA